MRIPYDPRLAGPPSRYSTPLEAGRSETFEGLVKLRLGHADVGSVLVPEVVVARLGGLRFYQPVFFGAPVLGFNVEHGVHMARFSLDLGGPRAVHPSRYVVTIRSDGLVRSYEDGAQLYRCELKGPPVLVRLAAGRAVPMPDGDYGLCLHHITNPGAFAAIRTSRELRSSAWNLQGTRALANVAYVYLTSLPSVRSEADLSRIAMSSAGEIALQTTSNRPREETLRLEVYRESTTGRTASLPVTLASALVSPPHLLLHAPIGNAWYEVVGPEIYRIGVLPGTAMAYDPAARSATVEAGSVKRFGYVVVGDASTTDGLGAPYDEENTRRIMHTEMLTAGADLFDFWQRNRNSDQMSGRPIERREFAPSP